MSIIQACRMCLTVEGAMYSIANTPLQDVYEIITKKVGGDGKPLMACYICQYMLTKCHCFMKQLLRADNLLQQVLDHGLKISCETIISLDPTHLKLQLVSTPVYVLDLEPVYVLGKEEEEVEDEPEWNVEIEPMEDFFKSSVISNVQSECDMFLPNVDEEQCILPEITSVTSLRDNSCEDQNETNTYTHKPDDQTIVIEDNPENGPNSLKEKSMNGLTKVTPRGSPLSEFVVVGGHFMRTLAKSAWSAANTDTRRRKLYYCRCGRSYLNKGLFMRHAMKCSKYYTCIYLNVS